MTSLYFGNVDKKTNEETMLKFFQRIRRKLLEKGRLTQYLTYAIGEIILVVIGILIALQINNWNTARQEHAELHGYLNNIKKNIQFDLTNVNSIMAKRDTISVNCQAILTLASRDSFSSDDLFSTFTLLGNEDNNIYVEFYFIPDQSGFEALKSSGFLGKLNGTTLESKLYEYNYSLNKLPSRREV